MAHLPSPELRLDRYEVDALLDVVESAIVTAVLGDRPALPALENLPEGLTARTGVFVTLLVDGDLNGCIGTIEPEDPIGLSAPRLALSAAFSDPRLPALRPADLHDLRIEVSLLSPLSPIEADSRAELRTLLRPGVDGAVVSARGRRGLFLPSVWEQIPDPHEFLDQLWIKAGFNPATWPRGLTAHRFTTRKHARNAGTSAEHLGAT